MIFLIKQGTRIVQALQVCYTFDSAQTKTRELRGIKEAMEVYGLSNGIILIHDTQEQTIEENGLTISVLPVWKWLLERHGTILSISVGI